MNGALEELADAHLDDARRSSCSSPRRRSFDAPRSARGPTQRRGRRLSNRRAVLLFVSAILCAGAAAAQPAQGAEARAAERASTAVVAVAQSEGRRWEPPFGMPLRIAAAYRPPPNPYGAGHRGIDISSAPGVAVRAPAEGTISFSGTVVDRPVVSIQVDDRTVVSLEPVESGLARGESVIRGQTFGVTASGGHCEERCVHLGVRIDGAYVNPMRFFSERPVLLPW